MGFFRRLFSPEYRHALAAEAEGDYLTAARSYALCGEQGKVTDMHLAQARNEQDIEGRIRCLRNALGFAPVDDEDERRPMVLRLLARALQERANARGGDTTDGRRDLTEAAKLFEEGEAWSAAGDIFLRLDMRDEAAAAYSKGGLINKVEQVLTTTEQEQSRARKLDSSFQEYELRMLEGQRDAAAAALRACIEAAEQKGDYRRMLAELDQKMLHDCSVELQYAGKRVLIVGRLPLTIGREAGCGMIARGPSVSREHAEIGWDANRSAFLITDKQSSNGTQLSGVDLAGEVALPPTATIGLGDSCGIDARVVDAANDSPALELRIARGIDRGRVVVLCRSQLSLASLGGPAVLVEFRQGYPWLCSAGDALQLNGARVAGWVQLIRGDHLQAGDISLQVSA